MGIKKGFDEGVSELEGMVLRAIDLLTSADQQITPNMIADGLEIEKSKVIVAIRYLARNHYIKRNEISPRKIEIIMKPKGARLAATLPPVKIKTPTMKVRLNIKPREASASQSRQPGNLLNDEEIKKLYAGERYQDRKGKEYLSGGTPTRGYNQSLTGGMCDHDF